MMQAVATTGRPSALPPQEFRHPEAEEAGVRMGAARSAVSKTAGEAPPPPSSPAVTILELPAPPSVNAMYRNKRTGGRTETEAYRDWKGHAGWRLRQQRPGHVAGQVLILVNMERTSERADADNRIKALFDLLVTYGVIVDDRFVVGFAAAWSPPAKDLVRLAIMPAVSIALQFQLTAEGRHGGFFFDAPQRAPEVSSEEEQPEEMS